MIKYIIILLFFLSCNKTVTPNPVAYTELVIEVTVNNEPFKVRLENIDTGEADSMIVKQEGADIEYHFFSKVPYAKGVYGITFPDALYGQQTYYMQVHRIKPVVITNFELKPYYKP